MQRWLMVLALAACGSGGKGAAGPAPILGGTPGALTGTDPEPAARELVRMARLGQRAGLEQSIDWQFALGSGSAVAHDALIDDLVTLLAPDRMCSLAFDRESTPDGVVLKAYCPMATGAGPDAGEASAAEVRTDHFSLMLFKGKSGAWKARRWASLYHGVYEPSEPPER